MFITNIINILYMTQLTAKRTKELLDILKDTKEAMFKDRKTDHPYTQWEHKRTQIKQRLTKLV